MYESNVVPIKVEMLLRREGAVISMHLVVSCDEKYKVMHPGFWPKGVRISGWYFTRRQRNSD